MRPAILMRSVYEAYLDRIERAGFPIAGRRIRFTATQKLRLVTGGLLRTI